MIAAFFFGQSWINILTCLVIATSSPTDSPVKITKVS
jgi:hypothetical protein